MSDLQKPILPLVLQRPASDRDTWKRAGVPVRLSLRFNDPTADGWLWRGPATPEAREVFWQVVQLARPVVFEFMNDAIIGLVWWEGYPVIAYDQFKIEEILELKRGTPDDAVQKHLEEEDAKQLQSMLTTSWGVRTPIFRTE